eukprot:6206980-Pleurochrysis_carterae.AAC.1
MQAQRLYCRRSLQMKGRAGWTARRRAPMGGRPTGRTGGPRRMRRTSLMRLQRRCCPSAARRVSLGTDRAQAAACTRFERGRPARWC